MLSLSCHHCPMQFSVLPLLGFTLSIWVHCSRNQITVFNPHFVSSCTTIPSPLKTLFQVKPAHVLIDDLYHIPKSRCEYLNLLKYMKSFDGVQKNVRGASRQWPVSCGWEKDSASSLKTQTWDEKIQSKCFNLLSSCQNYAPWILLNKAILWTHCKVVQTKIVSCSLSFVFVNLKQIS